MPKADATGLAPKKSAITTLPQLNECGRGCLRLTTKSHFFGDVSERRPWALKRDDRPAAFAGRFQMVFVLWLTGYRLCLHGRVSYPTYDEFNRSCPHRSATTNPRNLTGINLTTSWEKIVARYSILEPLRRRPAFTRHLAKLKERDWVVYAKAPFAGPEQVLDYVGRYTHRVAISNNRLLDIENDQIRFKWKDYRGGGEAKTMALRAGEFVRRFLLHVLPNGFQRIRYYGFLGNRHREEKLAVCRRLLGMPQVEKNNAEPATKTNYRDRFEDLTGRSLRQCPQCRQGNMVVVQILPRWPALSPAVVDSS
jgi:hypothetical protein